MMIEEFEKLTGIYPSAEAYTVIESYYLDYPGTKQDFCKAFRGNTDGLAQQIQRELNSIHWKKERDSKATHAKMASEIETLKKQLEREQEWRPYEDTDNVQQADYEKLLTAGDTRVMTGDEAKDLLYNWFGFAKEKVQILRSIPTYDQQTPPAPEGRRTAAGASLQRHRLELHPLQLRPHELRALQRRAAALSALKKRRTHNNDPLQVLFQLSRLPAGHSDRLRALLDRRQVRHRGRGGPHLPRPLHRRVRIVLYHP